MVLKGQVGRHLCNFVPQATFQKAGDIVIHRGYGIFHGHWMTLVLTEAQIYEEATIRDDNDTHIKCQNFESESVEARYSLNEVVLAGPEASALLTAAFLTVTFKEIL